jgi:hypothetical protein
MCRNIRVLYNFSPPTTPEEIQASALQYIRKVSGLRAPSLVDAPAFFRAVDEVAACTALLLGALQARTAIRTREQEAEKARVRGARREARAWVGEASTAPPGVEAPLESVKGDRARPRRSGGHRSPGSRGNPL